MMVRRRTVHFDDAAVGAMNATTRLGTSGLRLRTATNLAVLLFVSVLAIKQLSTIIQPMVVAVFLFFAIRPPAAWLEKRIGHPLLSYTGVLVAFLGFIILISQILFSSLSGFSSEVPSLTPKFNDKIEWVEGLQFFGYSVDLEGLQSVVSIEEINRLVTEFIGSLASFTANMLTVLIFLAFIILEAESLPGRIMAAFPDESNRFDSIAKKAEKNINVYIKTKATVALGQAIIAGIVLSMFEIPGAFIWAFLVFILDFIPYLGAFLSFIPPIILAFIQLPITGFVAVVVLLVGNQQVWGSFVEPQLAGQRLDMSPIVLLFLVAFWYWAWGLTGMILGVPLAVIMKILLESDERTLPIAIMLSRNPPSSIEDKNDDSVSID
tara:strand:- start:5688 stop:6824 length:1137 start_codon:yes stop_codon:yes gene_type:complete